MSMNESASRVKGEIPAPSRARKLTPGQKQATRILAAGRAPVEHGFANLKAWRILSKLRTDPDPDRATASCALHVLPKLEVSR
jgi:hypothetical protein